MTTILLTFVGIVIGCAIGWTLRRSKDAQDSETRARQEPTGTLSIADVLEHHPTGVVIADHLGRVEYRNGAARRLTGTHSGILVDEAIERRLAIARDGSPSDDVLEFYGPPKTVFDVSAGPLPGGRSVAFVQDISERRRVEQVRTDFVANISHELKTPVGALSVLAEMLVDETDPETLRRLVTRMLAEADRATRTIDDLMELSRIEVGGELTLEPVKLTDVVRAAVDRVTEMAARHSITISALSVVDNGADGGEIKVLGDRRQLVSAVGNLVENAVKYSEPGSSVQVRVRRDQSWGEVVVADQGEGIPQRDLDRIFERFYRVDGSRSRETGGTGLGLSIVRHVASSHGGGVLVSSVEGEGSTFVLSIPLHDPAAAEHSATQVTANQEETA